MKSRHLFLIGLFLVALICFISCKTNRDDHSQVVVDSTKHESIVDILSKLDCAGSGYVYLYNSHSIASEYQAHSALYRTLDSAYKSGTGDLRMVYNMRYLLEDRLGVTKSYLDTFKIKPIFYPDVLGKKGKMIQLTNSPGDQNTESLLRTQNVAPVASASISKVSVKPPNPCPIGTSCIYTATSISYFTVNPEDSCNVYKNKSKIEIESTSYDKQTNIKTFKYKQPITGKNIEVHYSVTYPADQDNVHENGLYIEVIE